MWIEGIVGVLCTIGLSIFLFLYLRVKKMRKFAPIPENEESIVIITGCDSGIGRTTALFLLDKGFHVVCTVLTDQGLEELQEEKKTIKKGKISIKKVDITNDKSVEEFHSFVDEILSKEVNSKIQVLINNAGVALCGPIEVQPLAQFIKQIDVNLIGHVRVYQHFAKYLRSSSGRLINICSLAGRVSAEIMGAYCASKYGMEAISDTLRLELQPWNISVSAIEPGFMRTPLVNNWSHGESFDRAWDTLLPDAREIYSTCYQKSKDMGDKIWKNAADPIMVTNAIYHAISSPTPKTRYLVGMDAKIIGPLRAILSDTYFDAVASLL